MRAIRTNNVRQRLFYGLALLLSAMALSMINNGLVQAAGTGRIVDSCSDLETIRDNLDDTYTLTQDIDCYDMARIPIGSHAEPFTGVFNGGGHTIRTYIGTGVTDYAGLFGSLSGAEVSYLNLEGLVIANGSNVGGLAGEATGNSRVTHVTSSMEIQATGDNVGGLIGALITNVTGSFRYNSASGDVSGDGNVGGLYGYASLSQVEKSFATGDVTASGDNAGGLIGYSAGYGAAEVYATGNVQTATQRAGGLIGLQESGVVADSYARGNATAVSPGYYAGGLIGAVNGTHVRRSYSTGTATGNLAVGGLVGYSVGETYIYDSFTTGLVEGDSVTVNSLVGQDFEGALITANAYANADNNEYCMVGPDSEERNNCTQVSINENPTEFFAATDEPLLLGEEQVWDVTDVWQTSDSNYPILRSSADANADIGEDLNGDYIPDSEQPNIGGYTSGYTGKTVAIDVGEDCELTTDDMTEESSFPVQDPNYDYENGLWEWEADCATETTTIKLYYYNVSSAGLTARKFSTITNTYFTLDDATIEEATINGQPVAIVTYQVTDNSERDMNPDDGVINDPAGIATPASSTSEEAARLADTGEQTGIFIVTSLSLISAGTATIIFRRRLFIQS